MNLFLDTTFILFFLFLLHRLWFLIPFPSILIKVTITVNILITTIIERFINFSLFRILGIGSTDFGIDSVDETVLENIDWDFVAFAMGKLAIAHFGKQETFYRDYLFANDLVHVVALALAGCEVDGFVDSSVIERYLASGFINPHHTIINM